MRKLSYKDALAEGLLQAMEKDKRVFVMGEGVDDSTGIFGTTLTAHRKFPKRVMDMPLSEGLIVGAGTGAALSGLRPVMVFARNDFLYLAMDQIANHAAFWPFIHGGNIKIPWVIRTIVGRGWGNGAQHSQSLQALFAHIPGLKVVMPASAHEAKGLLISAIEDDSPVIFIEHRSLYHLEDSVPEKYYSLPLSKGSIIKMGKDITLVALSFMVSEAKKVAAILKEKNIDVEIIDVSSVKPLDEELICKSVKKTGRAVVLDTGWRSFGASAEISALINEKLFGKLKSLVLRIALPDLPVPAGPALEKIYYPDVNMIVNEILKMFGCKTMRDEKVETKETFKFQGPF
jgi:acetoin:2,6-dichlorophenolindophenol oxidoreductase subunit beta